MATLSSVVAPLANAEPATSLCAYEPSRNPVPSDFAIQACVDGESIWLRNNLNLPITLKSAGIVGTPVKVQLDQSSAAIITRILKSDPNIIMPNDLVRLPIGDAEASVALADTAAGGTYIEAATLAAFVPGGAVVQVYEAAAQLLVDADNVARTHAECVVGKNAIQKAACGIVAQASMTFAMGKAIASGVAKGVAGVVLNVAFWANLVSRQVPDVATLIEGSRTLAQAPKPVPAVAQPEPAALPVVASWLEPKLTITPSSLGAVTIGMSLADVNAAAGVKVDASGDGYYDSIEMPPGSLHLFVKGQSVTCVGASVKSGRTATQQVVTQDGVAVGDPVSKLTSVYGDRATFISAPTDGPSGNAGYVVSSGEGDLAFVVNEAQGTIRAITGGSNLTPSSCTG